VTNATIGHNGGPDLDEPKQSIRTRWAKALFADPDTPAYVMAIAWAIHWYSRSDGTGAALSNAQLEVICGIGPASATRGKTWLRDKGYVQLRAGTGITKTQFRMVIPEMRVIPEMTPSHSDPHQSDDPTPNQADEGHQRDEGGHHTDDPRVIPQMTNIQERNSGGIQDYKKGKAADKVDGKTFWQEALNPDSHSVSFENGKLKLLNGERTRWLTEFGGDERRLDLALIQIAPYLQPNTRRPLLAQVESQLARLLGSLLGRIRKDEKPKESTTDRFKRYLEEDKPGGAA
jgi:hypothetical protein